MIPFDEISLNTSYTIFEKIVKNFKIAGFNKRLTLYTSISNYLFLENFKFSKNIHIPNFLWRFLFLDNFQEEDFEELILCWQALPNKIQMQSGFMSYQIEYYLRNT